MLRNLANGKIRYIQHHTMKYFVCWKGIASHIGGGCTLIWYMTSKRFACKEFYNIVFFAVYHSCGSQPYEVTLWIPNSPNRIFSFEIVKVCKNLQNLSVVEIIGNIVVWSITQKQKPYIINHFLIAMKGSYQKKVNDKNETMI